MIVAAIIGAVMFALSLYAIGQLLHENTRLRSVISSQARKIAQWEESNARNKALAQEILTAQLRKRKAAEAKAFKVAEDLGLCLKECQGAEDLIAYQANLLEANVLPFRPTGTIYSGNGIML